MVDTAISHMSLGQVVLVRCDAEHAFDYHCQLYLRGSLQSEHEWDCDRPRAAKRGLYKRMGWAMGGGVGANAGVRKWSAGALVAVMGHARAMDDQPCQ